ncbi:MAG: hypothetical protein OCD76_03965 [Reichenbachiella sp.]
MIDIIQVSSKKELKEFIDFPHDLYNHDPHYVPELFVAQEELFNRKKNPFFEHSEAEYFLAKKSGQVVGRIAAIKNNNYLDYTNKKIGQFGFFEVIEDYEVAEILLSTAQEWVSKHGLVELTGPYNFSTNETCGLLVEGHDMSPTIMMTYNKTYYADFLEKFGLSKDQDILSYWIDEKDVPDKLIKVMPRIYERLQSKGITIRKANIKDFDNEVALVFKVYNEAWEKNWGFVPMTENEFKHMGKEMKMILDTDFLLIAEKDGKPVGFSLTIPDFNMALKHVKRGRLLPFGIFKLLYYKRKVNRLRVITLGVVEEYRKLGIDAYFYMKAFEECRRKKMVGGEASWVLENNEMMNKALENINGKVYKRHRLYKKAI